MDTSKIKVLLADDHPIFLEGICSAVTSRYLELEIVAAVSNGKEAVEKEKQLKPDVVLLDIRMPVIDGVQAARVMKQRRPELKIIMLTTFNEIELISSAFEAGADGYILKESSISEVVTNIKSVYQGNILIKKETAEKLNWPHITAGKTKMGLAAEEEGPAELKDFSRREKSVFTLLVKGKTNTEIARELLIGEGTVRNYISNIYDILGVHNRTAVVLWAFEHNIR